MKWLFWLCVIGALHSYLIYPLLLKLVPKRVPASAISLIPDEPDIVNPLLLIRRSLASLVQAAIAGLINT
jgi:hypothetical protein